MSPSVENRSFSSFDGTTIAYGRVGEGPPLVMANGLGGTFVTWRHLYSRLAPKWRVLCWDYRGLYGSGPPRDREAVTIPHQCKDLERLLEVEGVEDAVFMGWSMGTQVLLEFYRANAHRFRGLVLLNGTYGRPFDTVFGTNLLKDVLPRMVRLMDLAAPLVGLAVGAMSRVPVLVPALQTVGLVGDSLDMEIFHELAAEFSKLDFHLYAKTLDALGRHDAKDVLETVRCPVLIITGDRDAMTPVATAREMASTLDDAQLHIIERASHYAAVEHPEVVGGLVEAFLERLPGTTAGALERTERFLSSSTSTTSSGASDDSSSKDRDDS